MNLKQGFDNSLENIGESYYRNENGVSIRNIIKEN